MRTQKDRCPKRHPAGPWRCTKRRGHGGRCVAYVPVSDTASEPRAWDSRTGKE